MPRRRFSFLEVLIQRVELAPRWDNLIKSYPAC